MSRRKNKLRSLIGTGYESHQMRFATLSFSFLVLLIFSCGDDSRQPQKQNTFTIDIQPFYHLPKEQEAYVYSELKKNYLRVNLKQSIILPPAAFHPERNRYRADSLIRYLATQTPDGHISIGLTDKDISTTKGQIADWGVIGLGFQPGKSCIASSFRLSVADRNLQLYKIVIHELGHTQGLQHCKVKSCYMRDAGGENPTNEETGFCEHCKSYLEEKGWALQNN